MKTEPNQALEHNAYVCHVGCGRGSPLTFGKSKMSEAKTPRQGFNRVAASVVFACALRFLFCEYPRLH